MKIFLVAVLLITMASAEICRDEPQRNFFMSFPTLSKRDTLANLFDEMSQKTTTIDSNYTDNTLQANFKIIGLHPHPFYNDHHEVDSYIDNLNVNVSLGVISVSSFFNYSVSYAGQSKSGNMRIHGILDPAYFTKALKMTVGYL